MENKIKDAIFIELQKHAIQNFTISIKNTSHQHATHFTGNGNTHFIVMVSSNELFAKKTLERHRILKDATASLMHEIHSISFKFSKI